MKILIVGTGVIGTIYGSVLSEKHNVLHFVRKEKLDSLNNKEITYDILDERMDKKHQNTSGTYIYNCVDQADDSYDLIIVPVKCFQLKEVLHMLIKQAPNANYLLFTLDWNSISDIDSILEKNQYIMGYAGGGGTFKSDLLWANVGNDIMLGGVHQEQQPLLDNVSELFKSCGIIAEIPNNPLHWLWIHNVGSAPLGVALAKYNDIGKLLNDRTLVKTSFLAMREGYKICKKRGVNLKQYGEVKMISIPLLLLYPMFRFNFTKNPIMQRYTAHAIDSIDEMVQNFKEIFQTGSSLGIDMPNMKILMEIIS
jgi:2-dehydropantoate 2-reductase